MSTPYLRCIDCGTALGYDRAAYIACDRRCHDCGKQYRQEGGRRWQTFAVRRDLVVEGSGVRIAPHPCMRQVEVTQPRQIPSVTEPFLRKLTFYTLDEMRAMMNALRIYLEQVDTGAVVPIPERAP